MTDLSEMRRVAEAATPGPWGQDDYENWRVGAEGWWVAYCGPEPPDPNPLKSERDAAYIATFDPPTVLALLDVARRHKPEGLRALQGATGASAGLRRTRRADSRGDDH